MSFTSLNPWSFYDNAFKTSVKVPKHDFKQNQGLPCIFPSTGMFKNMFKMMISRFLTPWSSLLCYWYRNSGFKPLENLFWTKPYLQSCIKWHTLVLYNTLGLYSAIQSNRNATGTIEFIEMCTNDLCWQISHFRTMEGSNWKTNFTVR